MSSFVRFLQSIDFTRSVRRIESPRVISRWGKPTGIFVPLTPALTNYAMSWGDQFKAAREQTDAEASQGRLVEAGSVLESLGLSEMESATFEIKVDASLEEVAAGYLSIVRDSELSPELLREARLEVDLGDRAAFIATDARRGKPWPWMRSAGTRSPDVQVQMIEGQGKVLIVVQVQGGPSGRPTGAEPYEEYLRRAFDVLKASVERDRGEATSPAAD